ncbi:recombinase family protein [Nocardioides rubriscoriae]|uniref:recombinase family protein n=1 Tax=Nocardioides rubriscoriae TaxID=642762 RepID=UPI0011E0160D|nr:recombinase family protein [Nocardioides rubriscoriae]
MTKRAALYARISLASEESVSVARQLQAGRSLTEARGWEVVGEYVDDGVSATRNRPEDRAGWRALLDSPDAFDVALIWKIDRLSRSTLDFLNADRALQARGAALAAVEDPVDMTSGQGRAFATILAVFAQMEAEAISARVRASRAQLRADGRVTGGRLPYGWMSERRGAGLYLAQDPERIGYVKTAAQMILDGKTVKAVCSWLDAEGAPLPPSANRKGGGWHFSTVAGLLRNPVLAGMRLDNPSTSLGASSKKRGPEVKRDRSGMPVIDTEVAILSAADHRRLISLLDARERPRSTQTSTSPFFSRLVRCGQCDQLMHRTRKNEREALVCPACSMTIATAQLRDHVVGRMLEERGSVDLVEVEEVTKDNGAAVADVQAAIDATASAMTREGADIAALSERMTELAAARTAARSITPRTSRRWRITGQTVALAWDQAEDDDERRAVLVGQVESLRIVRGRVGRKLDPARVLVEWRPDPYDAEADAADDRATWDAREAQETA